jgi:hypothetical protein
MVWQVTTLWEISWWGDHSSLYEDLNILVRYVTVQLLTTSQWSQSLHLQGQPVQDMLIHTKCEIFKAEKMHTSIFWFIPPCSLVGSYQHFGGICCFCILDTTDLYSQNGGSMIISKLYLLPDHTLSQPTRPQHQVLQTHQLTLSIHLSDSVLSHTFPYCNLLDTFLHQLVNNFKVNFRHPVTRLCFRNKTICSL